MGRFDGYLLVSDLDGTLFGKDSTVIPERNIAAINEFIAEGGKFSLATGRGVYIARLRTANVPRNAPDLLFNGAVVYDFKTDSCIYSTGLFCEECYDLYEQILEKYQKASAVILSGAYAYCKDETPRFTEFLKVLSLENAYRVFDNVRNVEFPWFKILVGCPDAEYISYMEKELTLDPELFSCVKSRPELLEITSVNTDKGSGLRKLAELLNIDMKNTAAVGDYYNDKPMLDAAAYSFVPENGAEDLKRTATAIVCHHENGSIGDVLDWLKHHVEAQN